MSRVEDSSGNPFIRVRGKWDYLRRKLKRRGVVEVNEAHPHHDMLGAIQTAIRQLIPDHPDAKAKDELVDEDYSKEIKLTVTSPAGKVYTFKSYASCVFACLRAAVHVSEEDYVQSLAPSTVPYLEFISNSRSGQDFYFSNNQRFVLKTDKQHCIEHFLSILRDYLNHFLTYPHSLLVKFLGVYSISGPGITKRYFLVMQSIFYPTMRLDDRFDLKGCLNNRYQDPNPPGKKTILVLKDQNFLQEKIELGSQRDWFLAQLKADTDFLLSLGVLDYSLLLGRHPLHTMETKETIPNLLVRMKKSFGNDVNATPQMIVEIQEENQDNDPEIQARLGQSDSSHHDDTSSQQVNGNQSKSPTHNSPSRKKHKSSFLHSLSNVKYLNSTGLKFQNRRLLLNCDNNLHIIDGEHYRYYVGVIDFFTLFRCRQRVSKVLKDVKTCCGSHSTETPDVYAQRFYEFVVDKVV